MPFAREVVVPNGNTFSHYSNYALMLYFILRCYLFVKCEKNEELDLQLHYISASPFIAQNEDVNHFSNDFNCIGLICKTGGSNLGNQT